MSTLTHPLQHISGKDHDSRLRRSQRHCQLLRQNNHQSPLCRWQRRLSRRERRTDKISWVSRQSLHSLRHGDQCQEDQADDNTSGINTEIKVNGQQLETVTNLKYLGSVITNESFKSEILSRIAQTRAALTRLKPVWNDRSISLSPKLRLMLSLVTSIFLYACELRTLTAELQRRIQAMEMRYYRKILRVSYEDRVTNEEVRAKVQKTTLRPPEHRKEKQNAVVWSCLPFIRSDQNHFARHSERGQKTRQTEKEVGRQHQEMDRPGLRQVPGGQWRTGEMEETGCEIICGTPTTLAVKG